MVSSNEDTRLGKILRHRRGASKPNEAEPAGSWVLWMPSSVDRREHCVSEEQASKTIRAGTGLYPALCGVLFPPLAMSTGPRPRCSRCAYLREQQRATRARNAPKTWSRRVLSALGLRPADDRFDRDLVIDQADKGSPR